jgi:creatinine amidohydrolase/Fe(II)-dependent formamide hydrolase-like protein
MIRKRGRKWVVVHCHGGSETVLGVHDTRAAAEAQHRAIEASKSRRKRRKRRKK